MRLTHASVFSGIGGPEIAATMLGWDNAFHCEINEFGRKILEYWYPNSKSYEDITKTDFSEWRGRVDVLTGGFPCQPFSYAGQRRGAEDDRYLWPHMFRCIDQVRPTWVVAENVAGILTMVEQGEVSPMESQGTLFDEDDGVRRHRLVETFTMQRICDDLEGHGYEVQPVLVPACAVGAPHRRDRVFIVARRVVADSDLGADGRTSREDEGESGAERLQERHEVRKPYEPGQVRREGEGDAVADTDLQRRNEPIPATEPIEEERLHREKDFDGRDITDTESQSSERLRPRQSKVGRAQQEQPRGRDSKDGGVAGCGRWDSFPTVSPVCGRYDGLSRNVVRYINDKVYDELKEHFRNEDLSCVWQVFQSPQVRQSIGRLYKIHETDLLLKVVFGAQTGRRPESDGDGLSARSDEVSERVLRKLRKQRASSCASQRLQHQEQLTRELGYALPALSFDLALAAKTIEEEVLRMMTYVRTESLKAYGNAIVPQVMYEIFRAIEIVEREKL